MENILGMIANILSLTVQVPQAKKTWKKRGNPLALEGVSMGTPIIQALTSISWCIYGFYIHDLWLPFGSIIVVPLSLWIIFLKLKMRKGKIDG